MSSRGEHTDSRTGIFISHIVQDSPIALVLKEYLQAAYGADLPVFVSSESQVTATVPTGAKTGKIAVTTAGGTATSSGTFTVTP
jgi:hypothetical protein